MGAGDDARSVDTYAKMFGLHPNVVRFALSNGITPGAKPAAASPPATPSPAPGDPGFASSVLGAPPASAGPPVPSPKGPAPGEPGFNLSNVGPTPQPSAPSSQGAPVMNIPNGAGQLDTSGVAPAGFGSGAVSMKAIPKGAGQVDMSGMPFRSALGTLTSPSDSQGAPSGATGGHYVGPQWIPGSRSMSTEFGVDEARLAEGKKQRELAHSYGAWAADETQKGADKEAAADVAFAEARQQALQQEAQRQQVLANQKKEYVAREHEKLNQLGVAAQAQVDPEAAKGSEGAQLFAAIGIALGQFGASLNGGTNTALQIVNSNIDRRIAAQQANINNAHKSLGNEQSLYKDNLEAFGDKERASLATKMQYLEQAKAVLDQQYAAAKTNRNKAQYLAMNEGLAKESAESADRWGILTNDKHATHGDEHFFAGGVVGSTATHEAKEDAKGYAHALTEAKIPEALAGLEDVDQRLDAFGKGDVAGIGTYASHVPAIFTSKEGVANRQAVAHIKNQLRKSVAGASLTEGEKVELDKDLEGAGDASSLRNFVQSYRRSLSNQQRNIAAGFSPEGRSLYEQRGGSVSDIATNRGSTPYQRPVKDTGDAPDESPSTIPFRSKR